MLGVDKVESRSLSQGHAGTLETLEAMASYVRKDASDPRVRDLALSIVQGCPGHGFDCEVEKLYRYVRDRITFRRDPVEQERVQDTLRTAEVFRTGDCDDKTVCLAGLLGSLGHRTRFIVIGTTRQFSHVFLEVQTRRGWLPLDPTPERYSAGERVNGMPAEARYEIYGTQGQHSQILAAIALVGIGLWFLNKRG